MEKNNTLHHGQLTQKKILWIVKCAVLLIAIATATLPLRSKDCVADKPLSEDGYYSMTIARNIAMGKGITIEGSTRTNGFQPFFTFLIVPTFFLAGENEYMAIRYIMVLHWLFYIATAYLLGLIAYDTLPTQESEKKSLLFWLTALVYLASVYVVLNHFNGLETGCLLFFYSLIWRCYQIGMFEKGRGLLLLGSILGLAIFVRVDAVFLVITISLYQILSNRQSNLFDRFKKFTTIAGMAFLVSSPWWLYNLIGFGSLMPTSGVAQQDWAFSLGRVGHALSAFFQTTMPLIYVSRFGGIGADVGRVCITAMVIVFLWKMRHNLIPTSAYDSPPNLLLKRTLEFGRCLLISTVSLVLWYTFSSYAYWFYGRYFSPMFLFSTLCISYLLSQVYSKTSKVLPMLSLVLCVPLLLSVGFLHTGKIIVGNLRYTDQLRLVKQYVPDEEYVAAANSGTLGYFRDRVVNLDGKVNPDALKFKNKIGVYLKEREIPWLCDWPDAVTRCLGKNPGKHGWSLMGKKGSFELYHYDEQFSY
jgi:hypothetical protein